MADDKDKADDPIEAATPDEVDGIKVPTRSTADDDIDAGTRAEAMSLDNMQADAADVEEVTPTKLKAHYLREVRAHRVSTSRTGLETRLRRDYDVAGKSISDEKLTEMANDILAGL